MVSGSGARRVSEWGRGHPYYAAHVSASTSGAHVRGPLGPGRVRCPCGSLFLSPLALYDYAETRKTRCMVATATITMDTVCGSSFLEAAAVPAEAAAGVEVAEHPEAAMAPHPGDLRTEWLSLVS